MRVNNIEFGKLVRKNLGNYEHEERSAKVSAALDDGEDTGDVITRLHDLVNGMLAGKAPSAHVDPFASAPKASEPEPAKPADEPKEDKPKRGRPPKAAEPKPEPTPAPVSDPLAEALGSEPGPEPAKPEPAADDLDFMADTTAAPPKEYTDQDLISAVGKYVLVDQDTRTKAVRGWLGERGVKRVIELKGADRAAFMQFIGAA